MLLSIIIPVFNGEKKIERCLNSVKKIEQKDIEIIIVDDGSTDNTKVICENYKKIDNRIQIISQKNGGVSKARNTGLNYSNGKYISFVDADDEIADDYSKIIEIVRKENKDLYVYDYYFQSLNETLIKRRELFLTGANDKGILYQNFLNEMSNSIWNNIYRLDVINDNKIRFLEDMKMGEDCVFNSQYFLKCKDIYYINMVGYTYYHDDKNSASHANYISYLFDFMKMYECFLKISALQGQKYRFRGTYYINNVFEILKHDKKNISETQKNQFKNSNFYQEIKLYKCKEIKVLLKKWLLKVYFCS